MISCLSVKKTICFCDKCHSFFQQSFNEALFNLGLNLIKFR